MVTYAKKKRKKDRKNGIPYAPEEAVEEKENPKEDRRKPTTVDGVTEQKDYIEYQINKSILDCHIEYVLAPGEKPKSADVICWGNAAKIHAENDYRAIVPLVIDRICWVYFAVKQESVIPENAVTEYLNHNIVVTATPDGKKFGHAAKLEKVRVLYGSRCDEEGVDTFRPLWSEPEQVGNRCKLGTEESRGALGADFTKAKPLEKLQRILNDLTQEYNDGRTEKKPTATDEVEPRWKNLMIKTDEDPRDRSKGIKSDKSKNDKGKMMTSHTKEEEQRVSFIISGESVLSGLKTFENRVKYNSEQLPFFCCITAVENVLSFQQAKQFNPLSFTLKTLKFLPVSALRRENIEKIRFSYVICDRYEAVSKDMAIEENIVLNYTRTLFTDDIDTPHLVEFIQAKGLRVKVIGVRKSSEQAAVKPYLYRGQKISSKSGLPGSGSMHPVGNRPDVTLLGIANIDISSLLLEPHRLSVQTNFTYCGINLIQGQDDGFRNTVNPTEVNTYYRLKKEDNLCHVLSSSQAVLEISARVTFSLYDYLTSLRPFITSRNRIFIALSDVEMAVRILTTIYNNNESLSPTDYGKSATQIRRPLSMYHDESYDDSTDINGLTLTGFLIDCVNYIIIYVEAPSYGALQDVWSVASSLDPAKGHVLYDSSVMFNMSYRELIPFGGFLVIALRQAPAALLRDKNAYVEGNIPIPAYKALMQIYRLSYCKSIAVALQNDLFPDYHSLLSLDLEFGVPMKLSDKHSKSYT